MGERRRRFRNWPIVLAVGCVAAILVAIAVLSLPSAGPSDAAGGLNTAIAPASAVTTSTSVSTPSTTFATPVMTAPATSTPPTASTTAESEAATSDEVRSCQSAGVLIFGNSTDHAAGSGTEFIELGWPTLLRTTIVDATNFTLLDDSFNVHTVPGQSIVESSPWGTDDSLRLVTYIPNVLDGYSPEYVSQSIALISPSLIDLQTNAGDIGATADGLIQAASLLRSAGIADVIVLPMNPVGEPTNGVVPWLNPAIDSLNEHLAALEITPPSYSVSPLIDHETGDPVQRLYEGYEGKDLDGNPVNGPDGIHFPPHTHTFLAESIVNGVPELAAHVVNSCSA